MPTVRIPGTVCFLTTQPSSPPFAPEPVSSDFSLASLGEIRSTLDLLQEILCFRLHRSIVRGVGLDQDVAGLHPFFRLKISLMIDICGVKLRVRNLNTGAYLCGVQNDDSQASLVGYLILLLMGVIPGLNFGVRGLAFLLEVAGAKNGILDLYLVVAFPVFFFRLPGS